MWKTELTIGEVAARSGVAVSALRFYEERGLIRSRRNEGNQRRYARDVLRRVAVIKVAQRLGLSLNDIQDAFEALPDAGVARGADWERLSERWRAELDDRIAGLLRVRDQLTECIGCGCLSLEMCPLRNKGDHLGSEGPGARLLE